MVGYFVQGVCMCVCCVGIYFVQDGGGRVVVCVVGLVWGLCLLI